MEAKSEERIGILLTPSNEILPQSLAIGSVQGGARNELGVGMGIAGQDGQRNILRARQSLDLGETIGPILRAAEQAQHDELRVLQRLFEIEVDGKIVLEL